MFACDDEALGVLFSNRDPATLHAMQPVTYRQEMLYRRLDTTPNMAPVNYKAVCKEEDLRHNIEINEATEPSASQHSLVRNSRSKRHPANMSFTKTMSRTKRGPFKDLHDKEETARTRQLIACFRCRFQRVRVCIGQSSHHRTLINLY